MADYIIKLHQHPGLRLGTDTQNFISNSTVPVPIENEPVLTVLQLQFQFQALCGYWIRPIKKSAKIRFWNTNYGQNPEIKSALWAA